jgi:hypothetical protein
MTQTPKVIKMRVTYRLIKGTGDIVAILLDSGNGRGMYTCYEHIGQHGSCSADWVNDCTFPTNPKNYKELHEELQAIYFSEVLQVVKIARL